jgi:hypothetical protein
VPVAASSRLGHVSGNYLIQSLIKNTVGFKHQNWKKKKTTHSAKLN